jgi:uncharacterized membrane protein YgcG
VTGPHRRFDPAELRSPGEPDASAAESADALAAARELEAFVLDTSIRPSDGFEDRVMAAIASEPSPRLVVMAPASVRGGRLGAFLMAVRQSWAIATTGGRPMAVRAQAIAFVLLVILAAGALTSVTAVTVGALLGPNGSTIGPDRSPTVTTPTAPTASPTQPVATDSPEPSESAEPTATAPDETPEATETAEPTETPRATRTPRPTATQAGETPEPTETPRGSDDHGGGGGPGRDGGGGGGDGGGGRGPG